MNFWFRLPLRTRLGIVATLFLVFTIVLLASWYYDPSSFSYRWGWVLRFGPLLFLLWLAWSDLEKIPWWNWLIILTVLIVCAIKPSFWLVGIPVIVYVILVSRRKT